MHLLAVIEIGWGRKRNEALVLIALHGIVPSRTSRCHEPAIAATIPIWSSGIVVA
jgi:hypothetical protein